MTDTSDELARLIFAVVDCIPYGKVTTYGQVARIAGLPRHARLVGRVLSQLDDESDLPWHRVINAQGQISLKRSNELGQNVQYLRLLAEGIAFKGNKIDLNVHLWDGSV
ncbi:MGMT family protein [Acinetobacter wanghuae]|uniref:MGMT family protein n=1 Tax=Acinetobacter wanghuae TaxID=2662362 RepID=UPI003AF5C6C0